MSNQISPRRSASVRYAVVPCGEIEVLSACQMPTFAAFKNGQKLKDLVGANPGGLKVRPSIV